MSLSQLSKKLQILYLKMESFCAYRERTKWEVRQKLKDENLTSEEIEAIIKNLVLEDFINESRFVYTYINSKFKVNGWGKLKIFYKIKEFHLEDIKITEDLFLIDKDEYENELEVALIKKKETLSHKISKSILYNKLYLHAFSKGYEPNLIIQKLKILLKS